MPNHKVVIFDGMETLIDMYQIPGDREYALWAYEGSGAERYWNDFDEFYKMSLEVRESLRDRSPQFLEYDIQTRFSLIIEKKLSKGKEAKERIVSQLLGSYWSAYRDRCYVSQEVIETLDFFYKKYKLGIVSNFLVKGGIEELLTINGIRDYFDFVVTSVNTGWRKPHPNIYLDALNLAGVTAEEAIFIGDDYLNDFITPGQLGFTPILYDRKKAYSEVKPRFSNFKELQTII